MMDVLSIENSGHNLLVKLVWVCDYNWGKSWITLCRPQTQKFIDYNGNFSCNCNTGKKINEISESKNTFFTNCSCLNIFIDMKSSVFFGGQPLLLTETASLTRFTVINIHLRCSDHLSTGVNEDTLRPTFGGGLGRMWLHCFSSGKANYY